MEPMSEPPPHPRRERSPAMAHYWRMMRWMALAALFAVGAALAYLAASGVPIRVHMVIATIAGVGLTVLLGAGLMLLAFMSSGSGHDEAAGARHEEEP
jgi:lipopolysaccharide export LptBFGC system permease protein LptF